MPKEQTSREREGCSIQQPATSGLWRLRDAHVWLIRISRAELGPPCVASVTKIGKGDAHANF